MKSSERLEVALSRIAAKNGDWHIVTSLDEARARADALVSDDRHARGAALGPLDGTLVGVKDNLAVEGLPWTAGIEAYRSRIATRDSAAVARLRHAGAVILGTLNMHEGALGATTDNPAYGRCANPLAPDHTPGGSSGGSGAAIAAGFMEVTLGTDTMGSVRIPAAYCGCYGLKPTDGTVPRDGLTLLSPSLDTVGPLAANLELLSAAHAVLAALPGKMARPVPARPRVGVPLQMALSKCESAVMDAFSGARDAIGAHADVVDVDMRAWDPSVALRGGLLIAEAEGAVALSALLDADTGLGPNFRRQLEYGCRAESVRILDAFARIRSAKEAALGTLREVDLLLLPTAPQRAFRHGDPVPTNQADFTSLANFAGLPAISLPVQTDHLPTAVQLLSAPYGEMTLLKLAADVGAIA